MTAPAATVDASSAQAAQEALAVAVAAEVRQAFPQLDVARLDRSLPAFAALIATLTHRYGSASAALAAIQYGAQRRAAGMLGRFTVTPSAPPPLEAVTRTVGWATQPLWAREPDIAAAERNLIAGVEKLVLDTGRSTITDAVKTDRRATGWARVTEAKPCYFCALLATRGAAYRSDQTASFLSHDHCRCHAEPIFGPYEPSARVREWQALYRDSTTGGNAARTRRQWRAAFNAAYGD